MPFQRIFTKDYELSRVQDAVTQSVREIESKNELRGVYVETSLAGGSVDNVVTHGLTRVPIGFIVVKKSAASDIFNSQTSNQRIDNEIILKATNACDVTLWIF